LAINKSDDQLLGELKIDLGDAWTADSNAIRRTPGAYSGSASPASFRHRFGSLMQAYRLVGYDVRPQSRDPVRTEKGRFVRVRSRRSAVKWTEG
jgi:hypothetical protein